MKTGDSYEERERYKEALVSGRSNPGSVGLQRRGRDLFTSEVAVPPATEANMLISQIEPDEVTYHRVCDAERESEHKIS